MTRSLWGAGALVALATFAIQPARAAEPLPTAKYLPLDAAIEAALGALERCQKDGHHISVEVMNANAMVLVTLHDPHASIHSNYSAHAKAYTVLSYSYSSGETTSDEIARRITKNPADVARIAGIPGLVLAPGGVLIRSGNETVGAIGVGGSTGGKPDEVCAMAGIEKIKARL